jgi:hypothetical protein
VVGVVVLASPPRDPIRSKRHNGRRLRALHTYNATTSPPPWSSKVWWTGRWDQQHDGVVLMVESICGQAFAYARARWKKIGKISSQTRAKQSYRKQLRKPAADQICLTCPGVLLPFYRRAMQPLLDRRAKPATCFCIEGKASIRSMTTWLSCPAWRLDRSICSS